MKALAHSFTVQVQQGFEVHVLSNEEVELAVVPELGAKIISVKNLRTGREWMWHPPDGPKLFANRLGDDFSQSPLVGADECLPTVAPCVWQGRAVPDHGEVWSQPWEVDSAAWANGMLKTSVRLKISPFEFERTVGLHEDEIHLSYRLNNLGAQAESFLWAFHPLLSSQPGDQLELPASTRALLNGAGWVDAAPLTIPENNSAKVFAQPVVEGLAGIRNRLTGDRLEFVWNPAENDTLGLWLTRGGWHGHHHFAIEPANGDNDTLALAAGRNRCGIVPASDSVSWQIRLRVGSD
jgi:galactose mutarotase-like enzyme